MSKKSFWAAMLLTLFVGVSLGVWLAHGGQSAWGYELPRFTEEREAAALHFVKKNLPELQPLLDNLKKNSPDRYQLEIREIYHVTELLSDLSDVPKRQDLELKVWIAENKSQVLVAKLATPQEEERKKAQAQLQEVAKDLVQLELAILQLRTEQLERQLGEVRFEAESLKDNKDKVAKDRLDTLLQRAAKRTK